MKRLLSALPILLCLAAARGADRSPNIVYIIADDLGYGDLSCYGQEHFSTPHIDRLADEGLKFTQHYAGATVCAPSRCSLMTGLHTGHCFVRGNKEVRPVGQHPIPDATFTLAEQCRKAGYATGAFGKWGLGAPGSEGEPTRQGFDRFFGYNCQRNAHTYYPTWLFDDDRKIELDGETYAHDPIMRRCLAFIRANKDKPFFCFMPVTIPHAAMHVPESYTKPFREQFAEYENVVGKYAGPPVRNPVAAFAGMMTKLDESVGQVLDLLEELGIDDNTVVMFTSDNGPHKEGGHRPEVFDSNGPLNGFKRNLTEGGIRVPMLVRWPGKVEAGRVTDHVSAFWDVFPTVSELIGVETPDGLDGVSFVPTLLGTDGQKQHEYLYWEFHEQGGKRAVRKGKWKAVQRNVHKQPDGPVLLFDLEADLGEQKDLAGDHPEIVAEMRRLFETSHAPNPFFKWGRR